KGRDFKAAALIDLSTVADIEISNPPWVKFQSAGWVNFPSAPTHAVLASRGHQARIGQDIHLHTAEFTKALPAIAQSLKAFGKSE
ncbi:hypothetical protein JTL76_38340, partial [Pseudomonas aeruginosa]|nr:hypothetical protein [Pseudomonas aeruginosa]